MNTMQPATGGRPRRALFVSLGSLRVGLGMAGVVVPGLPATVFVALLGAHRPRSGVIAQACIP